MGFLIISSCFCSFPGRFCLFPVMVNAVVYQMKWQLVQLLAMVEEILLPLQTETIG